MHIFSPLWLLMQNRCDKSTFGCGGLIMISSPPSMVIVSRTEKHSNAMSCTRISKGVIESQRLISIILKYVLTSLRSSCDDILAEELCRWCRWKVLDGLASCWIWSSTPCWSSGAVASIFDEFSSIGDMLRKRFCWMVKNLVCELLGNYL